MSVIVIGMELPASCFECVSKYGFFKHLRCADLDGMRSFNSLPHEFDRHPDCPLHDVPASHGRLIDAAAFEKDNGYFWNMDFINARYEETLGDLINAAPTVIEAEGEESQ